MIFLLCSFHLQFITISITKKKLDEAYDKITNKNLSEYSTSESVGQRRLFKPKYDKRDLKGVSNTETESKTDKKKKPKVIPPSGRINDR